MGTTEVKLPDIGEGVTEGEVVKWLVAVGDTVEEDQPVVEVMTDKATVEVPTPVAGTVKELKVSEGDIVPIESTMLILEEGASPAKAPAEKSQATEPKAEAPAAAPSAASAGIQSVEPPPADIHVLATPSTRRLAREMNMNLNEVKGTGLAGRVTREDVLSYAKGAGATSAGAPSFAEIPKLAFSGSAGGEERVALRGIRRKIAETMQQTKQIVPHFTIMDEADVSKLVETRTQAKAQGEKYGVKVTYLPFIMKALIATMREFPMFNASIDDAAGEIVYKKYFHIGFAADTPNGLLVPVVKNADQKNILQISKEIVDLSTNARDGKISRDDMTGSNITITNIGSVGGTYATPIINHPEVAIIGVYKIETKPVWNGSEFVPTPKMNFTATCDHRLIDGAVAANFLKALISRIENPTALMLEMV